jgi:hypothetical protein
MRVPLEEPGPGLAATERGELAHGVLARLWVSCATRRDCGR